MDESIKKFRVVSLAMLAAFLLVVLYGFKLQVINGPIYYRLSEANCIRKKFLAAPRGRIIDRRGVEIANTRPGFFVSVTPAITDSLSLREVARLLAADVKQIQVKLTVEKNQYMSVKIAHDITFEQFSKIEEIIEDLKGIEVGAEPLRNYPHQEDFCHLIGYVGEITEAELKKTDAYLPGNYLGRMGLEEQYENVLKGVEGVEYIEVDARGREVGPVMEKRPLPVTPGKDLYTTVDYALTESTALYLSGYEKAAVVALNPRTGEVLVLYSKPGFDPNLFVRGVQRDEWQTLNNAENAPMYDRAIMSCYPCGSTFKPFVALAAVDARMIDETRMFETCRGQYILGNRAFRCWKGHGRLALVDAIIQSCDVYFYQLGRFIGVDTIASRARKFGFGQRTGIDLPQEKVGILPDRDWFAAKYGANWTEGHILNLSIGQGDLLVTPLQLACAYALFVNGGKIPRPHLLKNVKVFWMATGIATPALDIVERGLRGVVSTGTGMLAQVRDIEVCGKTGTAQNPHGEDHSWFVGYAPADNPEILVCVLVENAGHGGSVAAPIAGKIITAFRQLENAARTTALRPDSGNVQKD
jgi:penicillin-binding protein 2